MDVHKATGKSALETVMSTLHAGGKFEILDIKFLVVSWVGISVVNALSIWLRTEVKEIINYIIKNIKGKPITKLMTEKER